MREISESGVRMPGQSLSLLGPGSPAPGCAFPLSLRQQRCPIKKARATAGQGSVVFSYWPTLRSIGVTGVGGRAPPSFRSPDLAGQRARPEVSYSYSRARSCVPKMRVRAPTPR